MAPPIKNENLPAMEDCRLLLKNAVNVKLNASASFKLTATDALVIAGFEPEVAKNHSMVNRFKRLLQKSKPKEVADGEPPGPLQLPPLVQQRKAPPTPNPMPPPLSPVLGGPLIDSRPPLSSVKPPLQATDTPSPLRAPPSLSSQRIRNIYRTPHQVDVAAMSYGERFLRILWYPVLGRAKNVPQPTGEKKCHSMTCKSVCHQGGMAVVGDHPGGGLQSAFVKGGAAFGVHQRWDGCRSSKAGRL
jgi:hypothetical protein